MTTREAREFIASVPWQPVRMIPVGDTGQAPDPHEYVIRGWCEVDAAESIGARALAVHAIDADARAWYARFGFEPSPTDRNHLILLMKDLRLLLGGKG